MKRLIIIPLLVSTLAHAETMSVSPNVPQAPATTVGSLPACSTALRGRIYIATDALLPAALAVVAAGGAVTVAVVCNGTNWIVL